MGVLSIWHWLIIALALALILGAILWTRRQPRQPEPSTTLPMYVYRDPHSLAKVISGFLWAEIVVASAAIIAGFYSLDDLTLAVIVLVQAVLMLILAFLILKWIYRSSVNARALGAKTMKHTPGWAVGWYFVPFLQMWKPFQAFREIWRASAAGATEAESAKTPLLGVWWALWIIAGIAGQIAFRLSMSESASVEELHAATVATQISDAFTVAIDLVFMVLLQRLTRMQVAWRGGRQAEVFA